MTTLIFSCQTWAVIYNLQTTKQFFEKLLYIFQGFVNGVSIYSNLVYATDGNSSNDGIGFKIPPRIGNYFTFISRTRL